jgi:hypothetical protein
MKRVLFLEQYPFYSKILWSGKQIILSKEDGGRVIIVQLVNS